jgi:CitB domain protein
MPLHKLLQKADDLTSVSSASCDDIFDEAHRILNICNICKYCNGYCEVFRASERHPDLTRDEITYLAHLCHNCRNCWPACQYAPPHVFNINIPAVMAEIREKSWKRRNWIALVFIVLYPLLTLLLVPWSVLFAVHEGPGAFYRVLPLWVLVTTSLLPTVISGSFLLIRLILFWKNSGGGNPWGAFIAALRDMAFLTNLKGGGIGCNDYDDVFSQWKRRFHMLLAGGFLMCLLATCLVAVYHFAFGLISPHPILSLPVMLSMIGGIGVLIGAAGLGWIKYKADPQLDAAPRDFSLLILLFLIALTGYGVAFLRSTSAMGLMLAIHMGFVTGFFATLSCGKIAHVPFRALALLRAAMERHKEKEKAGK